VVAADHRQLGSLLRRLIALRPGARAAGELRSRLDRRLMRITLAGGLRAVDRAIRALNARGRRLESLERAGTRRSWRESLANGRRTLEIRVVANRHYRSTLVRYETVRILRLSRGSARSTPSSRPFTLGTWPWVRGRTVGRRLACRATIGWCC
jgi:hypothetical protein